FAGRPKKCGHWHHAFECALPMNLQPIRPTARVRLMLMSRCETQWPAIYVRMNDRLKVKRRLFSSRSPGEMSFVSSQNNGTPERASLPTARSGRDAHCEQGPAVSI